MSPERHTAEKDADRFFVCKRSAGKRSSMIGTITVAAVITARVWFIEYTPKSITHTIL